MAPVEGHLNSSGLPPKEFVLSADLVLHFRLIQVRAQSFGFGFRTEEGAPHTHLLPPWL